MSRDVLYAFRRNVVQVRLALAGLTLSAERSRTDRGQALKASRIDGYKSLAIPVRRALNPTDRVSAAAALDSLRDVRASGDLASVERLWSDLQMELDTAIAFGSVRVPQRKILAEFLTAAALHDSLDRDATSQTFLDEWGTAGEALGCQITEDAARVLVGIDNLAAAALGEPEILPPPEKTPPPPPEPKEPLWNRIVALLRPESKD